MFRFVVYVDDKNLGKALMALRGVASALETPQPVLNTKNGKDPTHGNGTKYSAIEGYLRDRFKKGGVVNTSDITAAIGAIGLNLTAKGYYVKKLCEIKVLRRKSKNTFILGGGHA